MLYQAIQRHIHSHNRETLNYPFSSNCFFTGVDLCGFTPLGVGAKAAELESGYIPELI